MTTGQLLRESWEWHPSVIAGSAVLGAGYLVLVRPLGLRRSLAFLGGVALILLTISGPLDVLGDTELFSAHMLEHIVLLLVVPPLLVLGLTRRTAARIVGWRPAAAVERVLDRPVPAWFILVVTLYAWHAPPLYNAALAHEGIHIIQHLSFLVAATIFWWPVLSSLPDHRLRGPASLLYLFLASVANSVLGAVLTFTSPGLYPLYDRPTGDSPVRRFLQQKWGLTPAADQQLGGLFMWIIGGFLFLWAIVAAYLRWYRESGREGTP